MKKLIPALWLLISLMVAVGCWYALTHTHMAILDPKGLVAQRQKELITFAALLSLLIVVPVFALTFGIVWKYRASNNATYTPDWDHNRKLEAAWWLIPTAIISVLGVVTWKSSHELDPYKPLASTVKPVRVQVIALPWKWLFIYPDQNIATVNFVQLPVDTPIDFEITSDAPMNSFWIPQLAGQVYAMAGMRTQLHIAATQAGDYRGSSANLSGEGFAGMKFTTRVTSRSDFDNWANSTRESSNVLSAAVYNTLSKPSQNNPVSFYNSPSQGLYDDVIMKYMEPTAGIYDQHGGAQL